MKIAGSVALVTGANRGLGKAYVEALLSSGAAKVIRGSTRSIEDYGFSCYSGTTRCQFNQRHQCCGEAMLRRHPARQ
jgi:NAD(P)-dependent dehydrogenase (short-subunit alcohol dehydrogenase family)